MSDDLELIDEANTIVIQYTDNKGNDWQSDDLRAWVFCNVEANWRVVLEDMYEDRLPHLNSHEFSECVRLYGDYPSKTQVIEYLKKRVTEEAQ